VASVGVTAKIAFPVHPHMVRDAWGFKPANDGQDTQAIQVYLGHANIAHTQVQGAEPTRFRTFWRD
jgi:site-specific recombinase XerD